MLLESARALIPEYSTVSQLYYSVKHEKHVLRELLSLELGRNLLEEEISRSIFKVSSLGKDFSGKVNTKTFTCSEYFT